MLRAQVWTWKMFGECGEGRVKANFRWTNSLLNWTSGMSCDCRWWCSWLSTCCQWCWCRGCHAFFKLKAQQLSIVNCVNCFNCFNFKIWGCIQDTAQTRLQKCPNRSLLLQVRQYNYSKVRYAAPAHSDTFCTLDVWSPVLRGAIVAGAISTASWAVPQESAASVLFAIWKKVGYARKCSFAIGTALSSQQAFNQFNADLRPSSCCIRSAQEYSLSFCFLVPLVGQPLVDSGVFFFGLVCFAKEATSEEPAEKPFELHPGICQEIPWGASWINRMMTLTFPHG